MACSPASPPPRVRTAYALTERAGTPAPIPDAAARAAEGTAPFADRGAGVAYREHLARVLVRRALEEAGSRG